MLALTADRMAQRVEEAHIKAEILARKALLVQVSVLALRFEEDCGRLKEQLTEYERTHSSPGTATGRRAAVERARRRASITSMTAGLRDIAADLRSLLERFRAKEVELGKQADVVDVYHPGHVDLQVRGRSDLLAALRLLVAEHDKQEHLRWLEAQDKGTDKGTHLLEHQSIMEHLQAVRELAQKEHEQFHEDERQEAQKMTDVLLAVRTPNSALRTHLTDCRQTSAPFAIPPRLSPPAPSPPRLLSPQQGSEGHRGRRVAIAMQTTSLSPACLRACLRLASRRRSRR